MCTLNNIEKFETYNFLEKNIFFRIPIKSKRGRSNKNRKGNSKEV